ncbi:hypothetical protein GCM10010381_33830 [Streptomyces xantholiticus]|nr:hypothetical protein GCM10010381_33830 [Streptomyces xantholiticus]
MRPVEQRQETTGTPRVRQTEHEAQANLLAVLRVCMTGKLRCSEKTRRPGAATVSAVAEVLDGGDFSRDEAIAAFAWPMLLQEAGGDWEAKGYVFASPTGGPLSPNTDYHLWKRLLRDAGVRDGRLHDARHTAGTVLLLLGVPDVIVDAIMGWEPGGAARMRARYMHVTGPMLRKVADQVGEKLWGYSGPN